MNYKVKFIPKFEKELKRLAKKYPSLKNEYIDLVQSLKIEPEQGISLGNNCYKIRIAIASKAKGKSGGARVITYVQVINELVYLLTIFDKSEKENLYRLYSVVSQIGIYQIPSLYAIAHNFSQHTLPHNEIIFGII